MGKQYNIFDVLSDMAVTLSKSKYSNKFVFRGGFTLIAALDTYGISRFFRLTKYLDLDWGASDDWEIFLEELPNLLTINSRLRFKYKITERRDYDQSESIRLGLSCEDTNEILFEVGIDMSVRDTKNVVSYKIPYIDCSISSGGVYEMICDKLKVFSISKVASRVKDIYDLYVLSFLPDLKKDKIISLWQEIGYTIEAPIFGMVPENLGRIKKAWDMITLDYFDNKKFEDVLVRVLDFAADLYTEFSGGRTKGNNWSIEERLWL